MGSTSIISKAKKEKAQSLSAKRNAAKLSMKNSELRYRRLFEAAQDCILILDADAGDIVDANPFVTKLLGYSHTEFLGKKLWEISLFKDIAANQATFRELQAKKYIRYEDLPLQTKDGRTVSVEFISNVYEVGGKEVIQCNIREITQRKQAEDELYKSEEKFRNLVETSPDAITVTDMNGRITMANPQSTVMLGYENPQEIIGKNAFELIAPDEQEKAQKNMRLTLATGMIRDIEYSLVRKDGSRFPGEMNITVQRDGQGKPEGFLALSRDITERKRAEEEIRQRADELSALNELGRAVSSTLSLDEISATSVKGMLEAVHSDLAFLFLRDGEKLTLAGIGPEDAANKFGGMLPEHRVGECLCGLAVREGKPLYSRDIYTDMRCAWEECKKAGFRSFAALPLRSGTEIIGVLGLASQAERDFEPQAKFLETLANQVAVAIDNSRLFEQAQQEIIERKHAERTMQESQQMLQTVLDTIPVRVFWKDRNLIFQGCNRSFARDAGLQSPDELLGKDDFQMVWAEQAETYRSDDRWVMETGALKLNYEESQTTPDGGNRWLRTSKIPLRNVEGQITGMLGTYEDITKRKLAEEALVQERNLVYTLMDNLPDPIYFKDAESRFIRINQAAARRFGINDPAQAVGKKYFDFCTVEHARPAYEDEQAILRSGQPLVGKEEKEMWPDGRVAWVSTTKMPLQNREGQIVGTFGISRDITERKQAEEALAQERNLLRSLIDNAPDYIYAKDTDGRFIMANPALARLRGLSTPENSVGKTDFDVLPQELAAGYFADEQALFQSGQALLEHEEFTINADGNSRWLSTNKVPLRDAQGKIYGLVGMSHDITERKLAEKVLRENEEKYRSLFENAPVGILLVNPQGEILEVNPAALQILGSPSAEATKSINVLTFQPLIEAGISADFQKVVDTAQAIRTEHPYTSKWDKSIRMQMQFAPIFDEYEHVGQIQIIMEDVTQRKQAEQQIHLQLERLTALKNIDQIITSNFDLKVSLDMLLMQVINQLKVDAADVLILNPFINQLEFHAGRGFYTQNLEKGYLHLGEGYAGRAALERHAIHIENLKAETDNPSLRKFATAESFTSYYCVPLIAKGQIKGVLEVFQRSTLNPEPEWLGFLETLAQRAAVTVDNIELFDDLQRSNSELMMAYDATIEGWSRAMDMRDEETGDHTKRVVDMTMTLATDFGFPGDMLMHIRRGALLHDIGKLGVPDTILFKSDELTDEEWAIMKKHPTFAFEMLSPIQYLSRAVNIPYCHHERWDGTGYPRGLSGEQIPLEARIFAVVDVYDALTSDRPYRKAWSKEKALEYIRSQAGIHLDPVVVERFLDLQAKGNQSHWSAKG